MKTLKDQIKALPKADVHNHLHLGGSLEMLKEKYPEANLKVPKYYDGLNGLIDFINNDINSLMRTADDMVHFMEMGIKNSISDNVTYLEASIDIGFIRFFNNGIEELITVVQELTKKYKPYIDFRPDIGINKDYSLDKANSQALKCIESGCSEALIFMARK